MENIFLILEKDFGFENSKCKKKNIVNIYLCTYLPVDLNFHWFSHSANAIGMLHWKYESFIEVITSVKCTMWLMKFH